MDEQLRPMKVIRDNYDNPAIVTSVEEFWVRATMVTGSDFGRQQMFRRSAVERQIADRPCTESQITFARKRWAELGKR